MVDQRTPFFRHIRVRNLIIRFQIGDTSLRCGEMDEKSENHANLFGEPPKF